jgi:organic radical activating enzyme
LGNIVDGFDINKEWIKCKWQNCGCGADVVLSKVKSENYIDHLAVTNEQWKGRDRTQSMETDMISEPVAVETNFDVPHQILWDLGRRCNYDCSYCWPAVHNRYEEHKSYGVLVSTVDKIINEWSNSGRIRWNFGGGEPTLHPDFLKLITHLSSKNQWTMVTSNGTRDHRYWAEAASVLNSINLSAHFEGLSTEKEEDRFVRNIEAICKHHDEHDDDHWLEIKLMCTPQHFERAVNLKNKINALGTINKLGANGRIKGAISMVPIRGLQNSGVVVDYTPEQLHILSNQ